jgi:L-asparaginase
LNNNTDILIISTGGTFNKKYNKKTGNLDMNNKLNDISNLLTKSFKTTFNIKTIINKDSLNIDDTDRTLLLETIKKSKEDKIIIIHGTDTMELSCNYISKHYSTINNSKKIIFTGSMTPYSISKGESIANIAMAIGFLNNPYVKDNIFISMHGFVDLYSNITKDKTIGVFIKNKDNEQGLISQSKEKDKTIIKTKQSQQDSFYIGCEHPGVNNTTNKCISCGKPWDEVEKEFEKSFFQTKDEVRCYIAVDEKYDIAIFTDGSCLGNPGPGGYGGIVLLEEKGNFIEQTKIPFLDVNIDVSKKYNGRSIGSTTNNEMELKAILHGLITLKDSYTKLSNNQKINIYSDSQYCIDSFTKWISSWKKNNWKNSSKKTVKNKELFIEILNFIELNFKDNQINYIKVKAHTGNNDPYSYYNNIADQLATKED